MLANQEREGNGYVRNQLESSMVTHNSDYLEYMRHKYTRPLRVSIERVSQK